MNTFITQAILPSRGLKEPGVSVVLIRETPSASDILPTYRIEMRQEGGARTAFFQVIPLSRLSQFLPPRIPISTFLRDKTLQDYEPVYIKPHMSFPRRKRYEHKLQLEYNGFPMSKVLYKEARVLAIEKQIQFKGRLEDKTNQDLD